MIACLCAVFQEALTVTEQSDQMEIPDTKRHNTFHELRETETHICNSVCIQIALISQKIFPQISLIKNNKGNPHSNYHENHHAMKIYPLYFALLFSAVYNAHKKKLSIPKVKVALYSFSLIIHVQVASCYCLSCWSNCHQNLHPGYKFAQKII